MIRASTVIASAGLLSHACFGAVTPGRSYKFGFERGNLVRNWSFEKTGDNWFDESFGSTQVVTARLSAKSASVTAVSGSFIGRFDGTNSTTGSVDVFQSDIFPVEPISRYVVSMYVWSVSGMAGITPSLLFYSDKSGNNPTRVNGTAYPATTGGWVLYSFPVSSPDKSVYARVVLIKADAGKTGKMYFDDIVMEQGSTPMPRDRIAETVSFWNDAGQALQTQSKISGGGNVPATRKYLVTTSKYDSNRKPSESYSPYVNTGAPDYDPGFALKAKNYNNGNYGLGSLGDRPFTSAFYRNEPGNPLDYSIPSGDAWASKKASSNYAYVSSLAITSDPTNPAKETIECPYLYTWSQDVNGGLSLSWTDAEGRLIKQATRVSDSWSVTQYEYYPNGGLKKILTPLDVMGDETNQNFRQVTNYNSLGEITSTYSADKGLQKFWYNRFGQIRYTLREKNSATYLYADYDAQDRLISSGEQTIYDFTPALAELRSSPAGTKVEHSGNIYDNLSTFQARVGFPLSDIISSGIPLALNGNGRVVCTYALNNETRLTMPAQRRFVATFYNYNSQGEITETYKYIGSPASLSEQLHHAVYNYDEMHRLLGVSLFNNAFIPKLVSHKILEYDAMGRVSKVRGIQDKFIASYSYYDWGGLQSVVLGGRGTGTDGTLVDYQYHGHGWLKEIRAFNLEAQALVFQQFLGYEGKSADEGAITTPIQPRFDGSISQQLIKFASDVNALGPVRMTDYQYDELGRMKSANGKRNGNATPLDHLEQIDFQALQLVDAAELTTAVEFDDIGRMISSRAGVAAEDAAVFNYQPGSYRLDNATGKLSVGSTRDASQPGNFVYDGLGRMTEDRSKNLTIRYGWNDMPIVFTVNNGDGTQNSEFSLYDSFGARVSRTNVQFTTFQNGSNAVYFVGHEESGEPAGMYNAPDIVSLYGNLTFACAYGNCDPSLQLITLYYILDRGANSTEEQGEPGFTMVPIPKSNGAPVSLKVVGIIKGSSEYADLVQAYFSGTSISMVMDLNLLGAGDKQYMETYAADGTVTATKTMAGVFGRSSAKLGRINNFGEYEFFLKDNRGSTMKVVDDDGTFLSSTNSTYDYMPFGIRLKLKEGQEKAAEGFTGKEHDDDLTDLTYFSARYYDPELAIFLTADPAAQYLNPYSYGPGDPVNGTDPTGMVWDIFRPSKYASWWEDAGSWTGNRFSDFNDWAGGEPGNTNTAQDMYRSAFGGCNSSSCGDKDGDGTDDSHNTTIGISVGNGGISLTNGRDPLLTFDLFAGGGDVEADVALNTGMDFTNTPKFQDETEKRNYNILKGQALAFFMDHMADEVASLAYWNKEGKHDLEAGAYYNQKGELMGVYIGKTDQTMGDKFTELFRPGYAAAHIHPWDKEKETLGYGGLSKWNKYTGSGGDLAYANAKGPIYAYEVTSHRIYFSNQTLTNLYKVQYPDHIGYKPKANMYLGTWDYHTQKNRPKLTMLRLY